MEKISVIVSCPIDTYSGYGARARDFVKALLKLKKYDVKVLSQRWGNTRFGYLEDHGEAELNSLIIPRIQAQPDVWVQVTVPNEFQKVGKYNIGLTAGIETTRVAAEWLQGCNNMDLILTSSEHSVKVFKDTQYELQDKNTKKTTGVLKLETPIEILFEGGDLSKYFSTKGQKNDSEINELLDGIEETFNYLFVGHWLKGEYKHDRKNVGYLVKTFLETFKNKLKPPALILKTSQVGSSIGDREVLLDKIDAIRKTVKGKLPNIYLLHGEVSDEDMNQLYNHPKVKAMVSLTKGEGFGRPLLEFSLVSKPVIASGWSGHIDFLDKDLSALVGGQLEKLHPSAVVEKTLLADSSWFAPDDIQVARAYKDVFKHYDKYKKNAIILGRRNNKEFSLDAMTTLLGSILDSKLPEFPKQVELTLPELKLPTLQKIK